MSDLATVARQIIFALVTISALSANAFALILVSIVGLAALAIMSRFGRGGPR